MKHFMILTAAVLSFAVLFGCATPDLQEREQPPAWSVSLEGDGSAVVTSLDVDNGTIGLIETDGLEGILLSKLTAQVSGDPDPEAWESGYEITITAQTGYAVTIDTSRFAYDEILLVIREGDTPVMPHLYAADLPRDMAVKDITDIEVHLPSQDVPEETALILEVITAGQTKTLTLEQLEFFIIEGSGGYTTSAGTYSEAIYRGVDIEQLAASLGYTRQDSLAAVALDGFERTYALEDIMDDPEGTWILAYKKQGELLPDGIGPFRVVKIGDPVPNIPGSQSARMVSGLRLF